MNFTQLSEKELLAFEERILQYLTELGIQEKVQPLFVDHLGLRIKDVTIIAALKNELDVKGKAISSAIVNGREILIYKLNSPFGLGGWSVPCIELPYPKIRSFLSGWMGTY